MRACDSSAATAALTLLSATLRTVSCSCGGSCTSCAATGSCSAAGGGAAGRGGGCCCTSRAACGISLSRVSCLLSCPPGNICCVKLKYLGLGHSKIFKKYLDKNYFDKNSWAHYKNICIISDLRLECGEPRTWALVCTGAVGGAAAGAWCTAARPPRPTPPAPAPCSCWAAGSGPDTRTGRSQPKDTKMYMYRKMFRMVPFIRIL